MAEKKKKIFVEGHSGELARPIVVCERNRARIEAAIEEVQKNSRTRKITANNVFKAVERIGDWLQIPPAYLDGCVYDVDPNAQTFKASYLEKGTPESTQFRLEHSKGTWKLVWVKRRKTQGITRRYDGFLTEEARWKAIEILERFS